MGAPFKPVDVERLRAIIETAPAEGPAAEVGRDWLTRVELELLEGRALKADLVAAGLFDEICQAIQIGPQA